MHLTFAQLLPRFNGPLYMTLQPLKYWERARSSFWFLPSVMTIGAVVLAFATVAIDSSTITEWGGWAYTGGAEGASSVLSAIAGSMVTITGVVFSMTLVALSIASSQLGPRLLRNFMRDKVNQAVLGCFVATFTYCLLVLRTVRRGDEGAFVPHLSVTVGLALTLASVGVLIYFIHHISRSIQADVVVERIGGEMHTQIDQLFPSQVGRGAKESPVDPSDLDFSNAFDQEAASIVASEDGYVQSIKTGALMSIAVREDLRLRVERGPGSYVVAGRPLASVWSEDQVNDQIAAEVETAFVLGSQRTPEQDLEFAINQLVEIAVRALSPGVNEPFTAIRCIDRLGSALSQLAQHELPSPYRLDDQNKLRVFAPVVTFSGITDAAFSQIRHYANSDPDVLIRLLKTITVIAGFVRRSEDRTALRRHAEMTIRAARLNLTEDEDLRMVEEEYQETVQALQNPVSDPLDES